MAFLRGALGDHLSAFAAVKPTPKKRWQFALRATLSCAAAIAVVALVVSPQLAFVGLTGAMLSTASGSRPWRARAWVLATMVVAYSVACIIATYVGGSPVLLTVFFTLLAGGAALIYHTVLTDPPGPIFLIIGPAIASYLPTRGMPPSQVALICVISAVVASTVNLLLDAASGRHPELTAVDEVESKVEELERLDASDEGNDVDLAAMRDQAYASVFSTSLVLDEAAGRHELEPTWVAAHIKLRRLHRRVVTAIAANEFPGARVAVSSLEQRRYLGAPGVSYLLRWGLSRRAFPWFAARRMTLAMVLTCIVSYALQVSHPYWTIMTTALVMSMGNGRLSLTYRALHRLVGTLAGLLVFAALHQAHLTGLALVVVILALMFAIQMTAVRNYALGVVFVTPMALLIATSVGTSAPTLIAVRDRVLDTAIGVAASLFVMWLTGYRTPVALVRRQYRRTLRSVERVLLLLADGQQSTEPGFVARRDLAYEELQAARILGIARQELPERLAPWGGVELAVNRLVFTVLSACWLARPAEVIDAGAMASALQRLLAMLPPVSTRDIDLTKFDADLRAVRRAGVPDRGVGEAVEPHRGPGPGRFPR